MLSWLYWEKRKSGRREPREDGQGQSYLTFGCDQALMLIQCTEVLDKYLVPCTVKVAY